MGFGARRGGLRRAEPAHQDGLWSAASRRASGWRRAEGARGAGTRPALLEEVLELARDGRWIYLDTKPRPEIVPLVARALAAQSRANAGNVLFIASSEEVRAVHEAGFEFHVWIVNDPALARLALRRGADSLTTDCPGAHMEQ